VGLQGNNNEKNSLPGKNGVRNHLIKMIPDTINSMKKWCQEPFNKNDS